MPMNSPFAIQLVPIGAAGAKAWGAKYAPNILSSRVDFTFVIQRTDKIGLLRADHEGFGGVKIATMAYHPLLPGQLVYLGPGWTGRICIFDHDFDVALESTGRLMGRRVSDAEGT
jgi:hypothetical protein